MSLSGIIQGLGSNSPFIGEGRQKALDEARQKRYDELALAQDQEQIESSRQSRQASKQAILQRGQMMPLGGPIQQPDGSLVQVLMNPNTGQITSQKLPGVQGSLPGAQEAQGYKWILDNLGKDTADRLFPPPHPYETEFQKDWNRFQAVDSQVQKMGFKPGSKEYNEAFMALARASGVSQYPLFDIPRFQGSSKDIGFGLTAAQKRMFDAYTKNIQSELQRKQSELSQLEMKELMAPPGTLDPTAQSSLDGAQERLQNEINQLTQRLEQMKADIVAGKTPPPPPHSQPSSLNIREIFNKILGISSNKPGAPQPPSAQPTNSSQSATNSGLPLIPQPVAPVHTKPSPTTTSSGPPPDIIRKMKEGDIATGPDGSKWKKQGGKVIPVTQAPATQ